MAHCIKNVLNGVRGGSFIVERGLGAADTGKIGKGWEIVKKNTSFMEELALDMLYYSKDREPAYAPADANELAREVCEMVKAKAEAGGVAVEFDGCDDLGEVVIDAKGIRRCLLNLVSNAVDACEGAASPRVTVSTALTDGDAFRIVIADNGCGIPAEIMPNLFKVFFSTKGSKGTGFGLAVTRKIVREHGGRITVESEPGEGSTFRINLPKDPAKRQPDGK
jgi:signal transduction histidine kinase